MKLALGGSALDNKEKGPEYTINAARCPHPQGRLGYRLKEQGACKPGQEVEDGVSPMAQDELQHAAKINQHEHVEGEMSKTRMNEGHGEKTPVVAFPDRGLFLAKVAEHPGLALLAHGQLPCEDRDVESDNQEGDVRSLEAGWRFDAQIGVVHGACFDSKISSEGSGDYLRISAKSTSVLEVFHRGLRRLSRDS